jgi:ABC-type uncharacterized transport system ATPase subunit
MEGITKRFGGFTANDAVNLSVSKGEVHALLGENGAGKSTLMNILSGLYRMDSGDIYINGIKAHIRNPQDARKMGIGMVYQHFMLIQAMTVLDNIILSIDTKGILPRRIAVRRKIMDLSSRYGLEIDPDKLISALSVGEQQRVEIIKILCSEATILILDEPTAVLTPKEANGLFEIIRRLVKEEHTVIFISHKLKEVMTICDRITVLRNGKQAGVVNKNETTMDELGNYMIGRRVGINRMPSAVSAGRQVLGIKDLRYRSPAGLEKLRIDELSVRAGEILGIAGVDGNGQTELAKVITGLLKPSSGTIWITDTAMRNRRVRDFIDARVAYIPEDRNRVGLIPSMNVAENLVLKKIDREPYSKYRGWFINYKTLLSHAADMINKYDIRGVQDHIVLASLSGGNQQKVILAREIEPDVKLLVAAHPTRGLDIGASEFVHKEIVKARDASCAVLLISADLDEILRLSDRIAVIYEGRIMGYEDPENPNITRLSLLMAGKKEEEDEKAG